MMNEYLSDEELDALISQVEEHEMFLAPPDMLEQILTRVEETGNECEREIYADTKKGEIREIKRPPQIVEFKKKEYRNYCVRVITSVAAAIILLILLPGLAQKVPNRENRQEVNIPTKEEYMAQEDNKITQALGTTHIFSDMWDSKIFD